MTSAASSAAGKPARHDVAIAGAGLGGLALALSLRQGLGDEARILIADPALAGPVRDGRASAIAAGARHLLDAVGAWQRVAAEAQPMTAMEITDSRPGDAARPVFLSFDGEVPAAGPSGDSEPFAHMVPNAPLQQAMIELARERGIALVASSIVQMAAKPAAAEFRLGDGGEHRASLLCACDGGRSKLRALAGISTVGWSYEQSAIVLTVGHERDHGGKAIEHFLPAGPFAILPLTGRRCSIVWTETTEAAKRLLALPPVLFHDELERRFGLFLGAIEVLDQPRAYPLGLQVARRFVADRLALVADAAHIIHPIAGQGINMGFRDVAALAEAVTDAARLGLDIGGPDVLERYQRWRRFDTLAMGVATDGLNRLFSNRSDVLRLVRDVGLGIVDRLPRLKDFFIRDAAGLGGSVPKLLRGEAL
ncbi:ubiquinone biosynthesis hydroxylase [Bosea sp. 117]|uniref:ubiquinone biosynthesis hydroxylase n=1 Tax=Bosea sp. 117 TaxID=1125973 RepID=UPI000ADF77AF|nr:ubiquinone biosynthesis hydroxylase [Bosea sp. 117]